MMEPRTALAFRLGERTFAVDAAEVAAVARRPPLSRVPHAPAALAGVGAFNGRAMPVIDLARLLDGVEGRGQQTLLLRGEPVAVAVDSVEGIREASRVTCEWLDLRAAIAPVFQHGAQRSHPTLAARAEAKPAIAGRETGLLEFQLGGQRFAFPIAQVRAVVREPGLTAIPGADPVALGMAPHRDGAVPVVELARLLGLPTPTPSRQVRLIVVEIAGAEVALRIERALGALRVPERAVTRAPAALNRGAGETRVSAIARTPSGLVAILDAEHLFDDETMRRLEALNGAAPAPREAAPVQEEERVLVFRVGQDRYALPAAAVEAVAPPGGLSNAPNAPKFLAGVLSHRGAALPVLDARLRFGVVPAARGVVIVVRRDAMAAGLWVDAVERVARLAVAPAPALAGDAGALLSGLSAQDGEGPPLLLIDPDALLAQARRDVATRARRDRA
jgi:purine-binding chemotaxis protein CheW